MNITGDTVRANEFWAGISLKDARDGGKHRGYYRVHRRFKGSVNLGKLVNHRILWDDGDIWAPVGTQRRALDFAGLECKMHEFSHLANSWAQWGKKVCPAAHGWRKFSRYPSVS